MKLLTKKAMKDIIKRELYYAPKKNLEEFLSSKNIQFNNKCTKGVLQDLIEDKDLVELYTKYKDSFGGMHPSELEKILNINKTIRQKLVSSGVIKVAYKKEVRIYGRYINVEYYDLESIYSLSKEQLSAFIEKNYKKPTDKKIEGIKKAQRTKKIKLQIKKLETIIEEELSWKDFFNEQFSSEFYLLDTESTGLGYDDEVIEIAIIDNKRNVVLNTLVNTQQSIEPEAYNIHHIDESSLIGKPKLIELNLEKILENKKIYTFNAEFDKRILSQSGFNTVYDFNFKCLMLIMSDYFKSSRWLSLEYVKSELGIDRVQTHRALDDCCDCYDVITAVMELNDNIIKDSRKNLKELKEKLLG